MIPKNMCSIFSKCTLLFLCKHIQVTQKKYGEYKMKTDARVRYTKKVIRENFLKLIKEVPLNKITVKKICELSEINRATFYKYYSDPFDLMKHIEDELIAALQVHIEFSNNENITETLLVILNALKRNVEMYTSLISVNEDSTFIKRVLLESSKIKQSSMEELLPNMSQTYQEWFYHFMSHGFISILTSWIQNGMKEDPEEVAQFINRLNNIILRGLPAEFERSR